MSPYDRWTPARVLSVAVAVREQDDSCLPHSGASVHSRRALSCGVVHSRLVCAGRAYHVLTRYNCSGDEWRAANVKPTAREVNFSFASFAWSRAQGAVVGLNATASQPAPAVISCGKVPASVVRAGVYCLAKFEAIHLLSSRSRHQQLSTPITTTLYQHTQQDLGHVATQPTLANSVSTNRAASTSKYPEAPHRQTNRPSTRTSTPQTYHQHVRRSCHRPDGKHYSQRAYFHRRGRLRRRRR
jgi:hypothetical protein